MLLLVQDFARNAATLACVQLETLTLRRSARRPLVE